MRKHAEPHLGVVSVGVQTIESLETQKNGIKANLYYNPYGEPLQKIMAKSFVNLAEQE